MDSQPKRKKSIDGGASASFTDNGNSSADRIAAGNANNQGKVTVSGREADKVVVSDDYFSPLNTNARNITFRVRFSDTRRSCIVTLSENDTVGHLKTAIHLKSYVPPCQQRLTSTGLSFEDSSKELKNMNIASDYVDIILADSDKNTAFADLKNSSQRGSSPSSSGGKGGNSMEMDLDGRKSASSSDITSLTDSDDDMEYNDGVEDTLEPADSIVKKNRCLVENNFESETIAVLNFAQVFHDRYGRYSPDFYPGTLKLALNDSIYLPIPERKLLGIYLHDDKSVLSNVLCSQVLCSDIVSDFLKMSFVIWGWDMTHERPKNYFFQQCAEIFGRNASAPDVSRQMTKINQNLMPAFIILGQPRKTVEVMTIIYGDLALKEWMNLVMFAESSFAKSKGEELIYEKERTDRERIRNEQDAAYQSSLQQDRAKAQAKIDQLMKEMDEKKEREKIMKEIDDLKEQRQKNAVKNMKPEPEDGADVTKIRFRLCDGKALARNFSKTDTLEYMLDFLCSIGYDHADYMLINSFPRRNLSTEDGSRTLENLDLIPSANLILERTEK